MGVFPGSEDGRYGLLAEFADPGALLEAARAVRKKGFRHFDTHSPFPIHGMDQAMGLGNSKVGYVVLAGGLLGVSAAYLMEWWMNAVDYPLNIGGKPFFSLWSGLPIMFEVTVLFSALAAVAGMLAFNGLPRPYSPLFYSENFARVTDDGFFLHIAASDPLYDEEEVEDFLDEIGGFNIEYIEDAGDAAAESPAPHSA